MLGLLLCCQVAAQDQFIAKTVTGKYKVDSPYAQKISQLNGINLGSVRKVIRAHDGYMWMVSDAGLVRFDGYDGKFFPFELTTEDASKYHWMFDIVEDASHFLWISTASSGLLRFDPVTGQYQKFLHEIRGNGPNGLRKLPYMTFKDEETLLLCGNSGLIQFDINTHQYEILNIGKQNAAILCVDSLVDDTGSVWIATASEGLYVHNTNTGEQRHFKHIEGQTNSLYSDMIVRISKDSTGDIWVGTLKGVNLINPKTGLVTRLSSDNSEVNRVLNDVTTVIVEDKQNNVWISGIGKFLVKYDRKQRIFSLIDIASNMTSDLFFDDSQLMWLASSQGLYKVDMQSMAFKLLSDGPKSFQMVVDTQDNLWIGGVSLSKFDEQTLGFMQLPQLNDVMYLLVRKESLLLSHHSTGNFLSRLDTTNLAFTHIYRDFSTSINKRTSVIDSFAFYGDDIFYLATGNSIITANTLGSVAGLFRYDAQSGESQLLQKLPSSVHMLMMSDTNEVLIANIVGLQLYDIERDTINGIHFTPGFDVEIGCLYKDKNSQRIWICLEGQGLGLYDHQSGKITVFKWQDSVIKSIVADGMGDLWMGTTSGVVKLAVKAKKFSTFSTFNNNSGLTFNRGSAALLPSGALVFGGGSKTLYFNPKDITPINAPFETKITELKVLNKVQEPQSSVPGALLTQSISHSEQLTLTHKDYVFSLAFASLGYREPRHQKYAYKLEGLDIDWVETDADNRVATYTTLAAGDYTFRVKGSNDDGQWNEGSALKITVLAPWWATKIAYGFYVVLIFMIIAITFYLRTKRLTQRAKTLTKAVEQRTDELQRVLADKDRLIANISHEFRTPLTLMLGPIESELQQTNNDKSKGLLTLAKANGQRLLSMVDQLLDIARTKEFANQTRQRINVGETARFLTESYRSLAQKHRIDLTLNNHLSDDVYLNMQPDSLEKILSNLLSNAFKYSDDGQSISVALTVSDTNQLRLSVKDTGEGISESDQQQIFERFSRVYSNSKYVPGAGIGLALVKELVIKHQGSISVKSKLSVGSEFIVQLPLNNENIDESAEAGEINRALVLAKLDDISNQQLSEDEAQLGIEIDSSEQKPAILIIEDNQDMRQYMVSCLSAHYQCMTAKDGEMGIEMAQQNLPDLIITDLMMPKKDGFEVTRALKQDDATNHIPIILITARADEQNRATGWQEKVDEFLQKPFNTTQLINRINNLLSIRLLLSQRYQRALTSPDFLIKERSDIKAQLAEPDLDEADSYKIHQAFYESMNAVLEANYADESFGVKVFADNLNSSPRNMTRKMKTMLGIKPNEALRIFRLKKAAEMLSQGESAGNVAIAVGFASHSYFTQCFKAQYGCMPSNYLD
ncbi:MAG: response regulator [Algicola sp.]|nr:response regulator [Algicola sp.]